MTTSIQRVAMSAATLGDFLKHIEANAVSLRRLTIAATNQTHPGNDSANKIRRHRCRALEATDRTLLMQMRTRSSAICDETIDTKM